MEVRGSKRFWSKQERRAIVEETLQPGASVSQVARSHDVNSNQVFWWRKQYREGHFNIETGLTGFVPVQISGDGGKTDRVTRPQEKKNAAAAAGRIEIQIGDVRVRIEGAADPACVRAVLEGLSR